MTAKDGNFSDKPDLTGIDQPVDAAAFRLDGPRAVGSLVFVNDGVVTVSAEPRARDLDRTDQDVTDRVVSGYRYAIQRRDGIKLETIGDVVYAVIDVDGRSTLAATITAQSELTHVDATAAAAFVVQQSRHVAGQLSNAPDVLTLSTGDERLARAFEETPHVVSLRSTNADALTASRRTVLNAIETMITTLLSVEHDPRLIAETIDKLSAAFGPAVRQTPKVRTDYSTVELSANLARVQRQLRAQLHRADVADLVEQSVGGQSWGFSLQYS